MTRTDLTHREEQIFVRLAEGQYYKEIAHSMQISVNTVRTHVTNIYRKLGVHNKRGARRAYLFMSATR